MALSKILICFVKNCNYYQFCCKNWKQVSKNSKNNPNYLKFLHEVQVAIEISMKISQLVILFFTSKTSTTKTLKSNSAIKSNLSFYFVDVFWYFCLEGKCDFYIFCFFQKNWWKIKLLYIFKGKCGNKIISIIICIGKIWNFYHKWRLEWKTYLWIRIENPF